MIRTEADYHEAKDRLAQERKRLGEHQDHLRAMSLGTEEVERAIAPLMSFQHQLEEELAEYELIKAGQVQELVNLHGLGRALVAIRIARGMTQRELAERLEVNESQVSRDEKNEYRGITAARAARILDALGADVTVSISVKRTRGATKRQRNGGAKDRPATVPNGTRATQIG